MADKTILDFINDRLAEDKAAATQASRGPWDACVDRHQHGVTEVGVWCEALGRYIAEFITSGDQAAADAQHIARWNPKQVLAEVAIKRKLIDLLFAHASKIDGEWGCNCSASTIRAGRCPDTPIDDMDGLRLLAKGWREHTEYRSEWEQGVNHG